MSEPTQAEQENKENSSNNEAGEPMDPPKSAWKETIPLKSMSQKQFIDCYSPRVQSDGSVTLSTPTTEEEKATSPGSHRNSVSEGSAAHSKSTGGSTPGLGINLSTWFSGWKTKTPSSSTANSLNSSPSVTGSVNEKTKIGTGATGSISGGISEEDEDEMDNICNTGAGGSVNSFSDTSSSSSSDGAEAKVNRVVIREGYLNKQGHLRKNWLCRYFMLTATHLEYYKDKDREKSGLINKIPLCECDISMADIEIKKSHCFKLTHKTTKRSFYLFSSEKANTTEFERDSYEWIGAIQEVIDTLNASLPERQGQTTTPNVVVEGHRSYELVHCISHALLYSLGRISAASLTDICLEDFQASESINVNKEQSLNSSGNGHKSLSLSDKERDITNVNNSSNNNNNNNNNNNIQSHVSSTTSQYSYKFTDYAPKVFRKIRELSNVSSADYMISLTQNTLIEEPSQGRSNSFFYFTSDKKLLIKTITTAEYEQLRAILPNYYFHLLQNPDSLIIKFYGLHYISPSKMKNTHFVVMENIFSTVEMDEVYDLKGSTLNRKANGKKVLMDLDFCTRIFISEDLKAKFYKQIESDCNFLEKNGAMDYSLLLGIHYLKGRKLEESEITSSSSSPSLFRKELGGMIARTSTGELYDKIYYLAIIDILTVYNIKKQIEHTYKSVAYDTADSMSAVDPSTYNKRFKSYLHKVTGWNTPNKNN